MSPQVSPCPRKGRSDKARRVVRLLVRPDEIIRAPAVGQAADICARELPCVGVEEEGDCDAMFGWRRGRGAGDGDLCSSGALCFFTIAVATFVIVLKSCVCFGQVSVHA